VQDEKAMGFQKDQVTGSYEHMKSKVIAELKKMFNPELLNRIDDTIIFHQLGTAEITRIVDIVLEDVAKRLAERGLSFLLTQPAREFLAQRGYDPNLGARPLRRAVQRYLEDPLAEEILRGQFAGDCAIEIGLDPSGEKLTFALAVIADTPKPAPATA
jgi:ATP-dependent Clp protease ATP-binding subunit ClpC